MSIDVFPLCSEPCDVKVYSQLYAKGLHDKNIQKDTQQTTLPKKKAICVQNWDPYPFDKILPKAKTVH